ncbi:MAG: DUF4258 domain-containing protein [Proteobacteria bacterium]|nr:DUF4258 domain-containing protein [Pseudomonadota bacterium]
MHSHRFGRTIHITRHAAARMAERNISESLLLDIIETGTLKYKNAEHLWAYKAYADRADNDLCAAIELNAAALVVKTVMFHFAPEG